MRREFNLIKPETLYRDILHAGWEITRFIGNLPGPFNKDARFTTLSIICEIISVRCRDGLFAWQDFRLSGDVYVGRLVTTHGDIRRTKYLWLELEFYTDLTPAWVSSTKTICNSDCDAGTNVIECQYATRNHITVFVFDRDTVVFITPVIISFKNHIGADLYCTIFR